MRGFTLIELLVVIAIIGILAALVLVALGNARDKAQDARVKSDVAQFRTLAELYRDAKGSFEDFHRCLFFAHGGDFSLCAGGIGPSAQVLSQDIEAANGGYPLQAEGEGDMYCVSARMKTENLTSFCVDASGKPLLGLDVYCHSTGCAQETGG